MKKKIALICVMIMLIMSVAQSVGAINVIINSSYLEFPDQEPVIDTESWVTLVPLRAIAERLGLEVTWDDPTDTVVLKRDNFYIELVIGSTKAKTSSGEKQLPAAPRIINSRTMVPLRFIAEELGLDVIWNMDYQRVIINGQVDTEKVPEVVPEPVEESTGEVATDVETVEESTVSEVPPEEETEPVDETIYTIIDAQTSSISFEIPNIFFPADTESEESFAARAIDGLDAQHIYDWNTVTLYESYTDESETSGIAIIVQQFEPYDGEQYDISTAFDEYPEAPERPVIEDWGYVIAEAHRVLVERICSEREIEVPEGYTEMDDEQLALALGFASADEMSEYTAAYDIQELMMEVPEYAEYWTAMEEYTLLKEDYDITVNAIKGAKNYIIRNFSEVASQAEDDVWADYFSSQLNSDPEVRYDGVEIINHGSKKVIHAVITIEDPDDEQGVFDYYYYIDGDCVVTIYGGTLYGSEASPEAVAALAAMQIQ